MPSETEWTLPQAARLLGEPQHRLIYLCEKQVVIPDFANARGRGSSRRFSSRNLLELAIALRLKPLGLPASVTAAILHTLRAFEKRISHQVPNFELVDSLRKRTDLELRAILSDENRLFFLLRTAKQGMRLFGGTVVGRGASASKRHQAPRELSTA